MTTLTTDQPTTIPQALQRAADTYQENLAIIDGEVSLSWTQLHDQALRFAAALIDAGLQSGERVLVWSPNSYHWIIAQLGIHCVGGVLIPANTRYTAAEASELAERSQARIAVVVGEFLDQDRSAQLVSITPSLTHVVRVDLDTLATPTDTEIITAFESFLQSGSSQSLSQAHQRAAAVTPDDESDILFTSGTTGKSKGVVALHRQTLAGSTAWAQNGQLKAGERYLMINPYFHSFGYKAGILPCVLHGVTMVPMATYDPAEAMRLVEQHKIAILPGAPTIFQTMLDSPHRATFDLTSLRLAVTGAAIVPVVLVERMQSELNFDTVITAYGLTETCGFVTTCTPEDSDVTVATTCGRPFEGMEVKIAPTGEVLARGAMVMQGYLDNPQATAETIDSEGWLHTGDIGELDENHNLRITDRLKDMYITGGFNVYPAEIEQTLARVEGVVESAVIGIPDERMGEIGKAFVVISPGSTLTEIDVQQFCEDELANFKRPRVIEFVESLPRNASGKVLKTELR